MISLLKSLVNFFIDPVNTLFFLALFGGVFYYRQNTKWARRFLISFVILFILSATPFIPDLLIGHLEEKYQPLIGDNVNLSDRPVDIMVLGSGHTADPDLPALGQLSSTALQRLTEGIRIFEELPSSHLIVSGYEDESSRSQAEVLSDAAISLGIPKDQISLQSEPSTTEEEAVAYLEKYGKDRQLILVTSAAHMPRAIYLFRKKGLDPIPAPAGFEVVNDPTTPFDWDIFSSRNFRKVEAALHEYIGLIWARM